MFNGKDSPYLEFVTECGLYLSISSRVRLLLSRLYAGLFGRFVFTGIGR